VQYLRHRRTAFMYPTTSPMSDCENDRKVVQRDVGNSVCRQKSNQRLGAIFPRPLKNQRIGSGIIQEHATKCISLNNEAEANSKLMYQKWTAGYLYPVILARALISVLVCADQRFPEHYVLHNREMFRQCFQRCDDFDRRFSPIGCEAEKDGRMWRYPRGQSSSWLSR